ncbi:ABC transporter permease [Paenibacillus sp. UNC451MF]|uniref:ABC transporter permease n=1 Tax=Paenibacillus sp. UNC451MF TaxID=1449063 RepID=UPI00068DDC43|nr:ABC transporter permease subunit [Paenibacillus sp. UNC451MF]
MDNKSAALQQTAMHLPKRSGFWERVRQHRMMYLFLLPAFVVTIIFAFIPMFGLIMAFQDYTAVQGFMNSPFVGLKHFISMWSNPEFILGLKNTVFLNGMLILIGFPLPILFALLLNEIRSMLFKRVSQTISYLPHFISWVVVAGLVYKLLEEDFGSVNLLLQALGFEKISFMREVDYFRGIFVTTVIWKELGWNSIIFLAALTSIDQDQYEAATIDGASRFQKLLYITLPGIANVIGLMFIFKIATIFGGGGGGASFDAVYNMGNPLVAEASLTLDYHVYLAGIRHAEISYGTAVGLVLSILSFGILILSNRISKKISGYGAF